MGVLSSIFNLPFSLDAFVLVSLVLQSGLLVFAPIRKSRGVFWRITIIQAFLMESAFSRYVLNSIPNNNSTGGRTGELRLFWAPFLILHLGGPNTLTSLVSADNELWSRFALRFFTLSNSFFLACYRRSFVHNPLVWPTALIFFAALIRYLEKVISRYLARLSKFAESILPTPDAGVNYAELMETHCSFKEGSHIPVGFKVESSEAPLGDETAAARGELGRVGVVRAAHRYFQQFQGLFVSSVYSYEQRDRVRHEFLRRGAEEAFAICQAELDLAYDVFYSKAILTHRWKYSPIGNFVSLALQLAALVLWVRIDKRHFHKNSVLVTNILVGGSIGLDVLSVIMYFTSDWGLVRVTKQQTEASGIGQLILSSIYEFKLSLGSTLRPPKPIPACNLLLRFLVPIGPWNAYGVDKTTVISEGFRDIIFKELILRSELAQHPCDLKEICSSRGEWILALLSRKRLDLTPGFDLAATFRPWIGDVEFEESVILWHIATTLCFCTTTQSADLRNFSRTLSDYMLYLLIRNPDLMPPSAGFPAQIILQDTLAEGRRFSRRVLTRFVRPWAWGLGHEKHLNMAREFCESVLAVDTDIVSPRRIRGNESKAVLFDACALAKKLRWLEEEKEISKWEIISKVLVEMLFYAATHSPPSEHVAKLSTGGELLTLVWLMMPHCGLGNSFRHKRLTTAAFVIDKHV